MGSAAKPWQVVGLSDRQAAAHLLQRFSFGPRPGEVDRVVALGLERWFEEQLAGRANETRLETYLAPLQSLELPLAEMVERYPDAAAVLRQAERAGVTRDQQGATPEADRSRRELRREVAPWAREQGYHAQRELLADLLTQKLYRGVFAENQLREVLVDFWSNHLYVSLTDRSTRPYLLAYERDAIRPRVLGSFRALLGASARHPAMLLYLDNARSTAAEGQVTTFDRRPPGGMGMAMGQGQRGGFGGGRGGRGGGQRGGGPRGGQLGGRGGSQGGGAPSAQGRPERARGLNENYARELLELHTLGVDGGYTQADVIAVARAFTGWSVKPAGALRREAENRLARVGGGMGFVVDGEFVFRADTHDAATKVVLGQKLAAGRGIEDGEQVLDLLARHPATARHLARKLAVRFVADQPPPALIDRLAKSFHDNNGDLGAMMRALFASPELWAREALQAKIKSPYELAVSALRATDAELSDPAATLEWIARMGQPLYLAQAPTGYGEQAEAWVSTGSLLNRMNFGLELAGGRVRGVALDLPKLDGTREPESRREALATYLGLLLPERDVAAAIELLAPIVEAPDFVGKVAAEASKDRGGEGTLQQLFAEEPSALATAMGAQAPSPLGRLFAGRWRQPLPVTREPTALEAVVGVILGSPEFQRR